MHPFAVAALWLFAQCGPPPDSDTDVGECGDGTCDPSEDIAGCPDDCVEPCGDTVCDASIGEDHDNCPADCDDPCGDTVCDASIGEDHDSCPADCDDPCGDTVCDASIGEDHDNCPADCDEAPCGNDACDVAGGETFSNCPVDCEGECGDLVCDPTEGVGACAFDCHCGDTACDADIEDTTTCSIDCACGDGVCDGSEDESLCADDCACGNGICTPESGEDADSCGDDCDCGDGVCHPNEENAEDCPDDCACGDGLCDISEDLESCWVDCQCGTGVDCSDRLDCGPDGIDVDQDGVADEDTCVDAPEVTCSLACDPEGGDCLANDRVVLDGTDGFTAFFVTATGDVAGGLWTVSRAPVGAVQQVEPFDSDVAEFVPLVAGDYTLRYTASNLAGETSACEVDVQAVPIDGLHVMITWETADPGDDNSDVDLHMLHFSGPRWFHPRWDCYYDNCEDPGDVDSGGAPVSGLRWGATLDVDDTSGFGPENTRVTDPSDGTYSVALHYYDDGGFGPADAIVRIFCGGAQRYVTMVPDLANLVDSSGDCDAGTAFIVVADVTWVGDDCTVAPRAAECLGDAEASCSERYATCAAPGG